MRGLIQFAIFLVIVFFVVGEFLGGWFLGVAPQTPVYVYKKTHTASIQRRALNANEFPFTVKGRLSRGTVTVQAIYERPASFQNQGRKVSPPKVLVEESFVAKQPILVSDTVGQGPGVYRVRLIFDDATGSVNVDVPPSSGL